MTRVRSRFSFLAATGAGTVLAAAPCRGLAQATKLRMAGVSAGSFGQPYFAKDAGAFARQGFDVDVSFAPTRRDCRRDRRW